MDSPDRNTIIVIGGGPAGMMAAIGASSGGRETILVEKNAAVGKKLLLTGGGRCNLTNMCCPGVFFDHYSRTGNFLRDAIKVLGNKDLVEFFNKRGLATRTEDRGRVFPATDKARSVLDVLEKEIKTRGVKILSKKRVRDIQVEKGIASGIVCVDGSTICGGKIVLATGGLSYKITGSTGEGIMIAERTGHRIVPLRQGLVSLELAGIYPGSMEGLSMEAVRLTFRSNRSKFVSGCNSLLFTKNGISGPVTLSSSAKVVDWLGDGRRVSVEIDLMPKTNLKDIRAMLSRKFGVSAGKTLKNVLRTMVPARLAEVLLKIEGVLPGDKANRITEQEITSLAVLLKGLRFDVSRSGSFDKAQITRGGVSVKDIDPKTMGSKKIKGLYFAGEIIDVDGDCGGYNLQAAFSTGYLAGVSAGKSI